MTTLLISNAIIVSFSSNNAVLQDHSILVEDGKIKKIAPSSEFSDFKGKEIDARGRIVLPGFINAHMHYYSTLSRGLSKCAPSANFNEVLDNLWWKLDRKLTEEDSYYSALIPMLDAIKNGTTTLIDHHASPMAIEGSLDIIAKAGKETGLRNSLCYELSDRDGKEVTALGIKENADFIKKCNEANDDKLKAMFGLHASFTVSDDSIERAKASIEGMGVGFHVHTAEALSDQEHCIKEHNERVVERYKRLGILGEKTICVHCVHINEHEMDILAETNTAVVHNPQSNLNNAVGIADIIKMTEKGITVGLGTDAMTVNMLEELRTCMWVQKYSHNNPSAGFMECTGALAVNNAEIAGRQWKGLGLGKLEEGNAADIIILDQIPPTPLDENSWLGHLVFGFAAANVDTTIVGGKVLMENKQLTLDIDEVEVMAKSRELAKNLWDRF